MDHLNGRAPGAVAAKIRRLLSDRDLRERVGRGGRDFVRRHLNWDRVGEKMENLLLGVVHET